MCEEEALLQLKPVSVHLCLASIYSLHESNCYILHTVSPILLPPGTGIVSVSVLEKVDQH